MGKYIELPDAYLSVTEALDHAGWAAGPRRQRALGRLGDPRREDDVDERLAGAAGIVVPGGFGHRGIEGKVLAARYAREHRVPYLGLCLGLQCGVIEFARDVVGERDANSTEFDLFTAAPVIDYMPDQRDMEEKGGTMRLGLYPARLTPGSKVQPRYGSELIYERHRHRFEVSNRYREALEAAGMLLSGQSPDGRLVEIIELRDHPWFVASQFHPEFKSRPGPAAPALRRLRARPPSSRLLARMPRPLQCHCPSRKAPLTDQALPTDLGRPELTDLLGKRTPTWSCHAVRRDDVDKRQCSQHKANPNGFDRLPGGPLSPHSA